MRVKDTLLRGGVALPVLSGFLIGTSYIPFPPWAVLVCFLPLWIQWDHQTSLGSVIRSGLICSFVFTLIGFNWVAYTLHEFAHLDWFLSGLGLVLFAGLAHLFVPISGALWFLLRRWLSLEAWRSQALMVLLTILAQAHVPMLFDWHFGYSWLWAQWPLSQLAEWIGFEGLSAVAVVFNGLILGVGRQPSARARLLGLGLLFMLFLAMNGLGGWLLATLPPADATLRVVMVQGNIGNSEKMAAELGQGYPDRILETYLDLSGRALDSVNGPVDFLLWPETAFPDFLGEGLRANPRRDRLQAFLKERQLWLVTGAYGFDRASGRLTNSVFALNPDGEKTQPPYSKTMLLAFGEYLPGEAWFPKLREWLPPIGSFQRGGGPEKPLEVRGIPLGVQICYESLFPAFTRSWSDLGAVAFVNVTNDSWYGNWAEPWQHLTMTLARGVEFRRPILRSTNTGISTVGLPSGERLMASDLDVAWAQHFDIPYRHVPKPTVYQRWPMLVPGAVVLSLTGLLWGGFIRRGGNAR